jgi:hypothetical protein
MPSQLRSNAAMPDSSTEASIGMVEQLVDAPSWCRPLPCRRFLQSPRPSRRVVGALADPAEGEHFGELVLAEVLEDRAKLFLDAVVDRVVEHRERALILVVDIVGRFVRRHSRRRLRLIFACPQDDPAQGFERGCSGSISNASSYCGLTTSKGWRFLRILLFVDRGTRATYIAARARPAGAASMKCRRTSAVLGSSPSWP